jgi:two-component system OmpR family sensor kinase
MLEERAMTLRARLVAALVTLLAVGMAVYGVGTYAAFAAAERGRLDRELRAALPVVQRELLRAAQPDGDGGPDGDDGRPGRPGGGRPGGGGGGLPPRVAPGTYAALLADDGTVVAELQVAGGSAQPDLTGADLTGADLPREGRVWTVGSQAGSGDWRVLAAPGPLGSAVVLAVPTASLAQGLRRLLAIEVVAGLALLAALAAGSWLVLRHGLRPLERMTAAAGAITAGSLERRVPVDGGAAEVATLGTAINGMLDDLEQAFAARAATEQRLRRFVADASHELRTPLTSIQGYAELFRLGRGAPHPDAAGLDTDVVVRRIEEESGRMRRLVEDLLTLARLDEPRPRASDPVDLAVLAADACSDAVALDPGRPVQLHAPAPVPVRGDEGLLRQALTNLVANAVRHTPPGTPIEVSATAAADLATLVVRDHGPGLPPGAAAHAFDRFWQADEARAGTGTGLGLSIVRAVALEHGGTATAATHPGGGAVLTLVLPLDHPTRPDPEDPADAR